MIEHEVEQGSPEWYLLRSTMPTASAFDKIITSQGKPSTQAKTYMNKLLANWLMAPDIDADDYQSAWMQRGQEFEEEARLWYEFRTSTDVRTVGFCTSDNEWYGCSPDGLIGEDGGLEIKCPSPGVHTGYLLDRKLPTKYFCQVQGCLFVTGREWWDFVSYHPAIDPLVIRVFPDTDFQVELKQALHKFCTKLEANKVHLQQQGHAA